MLFVLGAFGTLRVLFILTIPLVCNPRPCQLQRLPASAYEPLVPCRNQTDPFGGRLLNEHAEIEVSVAFICLSLAGVIISTHPEHSKC
jgi:hypothetical protein